MAIREILKFPDPRLREISTSVTVFDQDLENLVEDMKETMYDAKGIGLAAPQIGVLQRVIVIDTRPRDEKGRRYQYDEMTELEKKITQPLVLINPELVQGEGRTTFDEGCLSIPGYFETVERFEKIRMSSRTLDGGTIVYEVDGLLAICMQHEIDHLEGKLFLDHLSFLKGKRIKDQIKKHGYPVKPTDKDSEEYEV